MRIKERQAIELGDRTYSVAYKNQLVICRYHTGDVEDKISLNVDQLIELRKYIDEVLKDDS